MTSRPAFVRPWRTALSLMALAVVSVPVPTSGQESLPDDEHITSRPVHRAMRASGGIEIDGVLDEAAWAAAPVIDQFIQVDPEEGEPAASGPKPESCTTPRPSTSVCASTTGVRSRAGWDAGT